jgi:hypothetical protein
MTVAKLAIYRDERLEREVELRPGTVRIGRSDQNDIVLADPGKSVSRFHAELRFDQGRYSIVDLNSQNGTWVAGTRVQQALLEPGVPVTLGTCRLVLVDEEETVVMAPTPRPPEPAVRAAAPVPPVPPPAVLPLPAAPTAPAPAAARAPETPMPPAPAPRPVPPAPPRAAAPRPSPPVQAATAQAPHSSSKFIWIGLLVVLALAAMAAAIIFWPVGK